MLILDVDGSFADWRIKARFCLAQAITPEHIHWRDQSLPSETLLFTDFFEPVPEATAPLQTFKIPKAFLSRAKIVACLRDPMKWELLYTLLFQLTHNKHFLEIHTDPTIRRFDLAEKAVLRDCHKMTAFVRFRKHEPTHRFIAWYEPDHLILERTAPFFAKRFGDMPFSILTKDRCAHFDPDTQSLTFTSGVPAPNQANLPTSDVLEDIWQTYYTNIFNPARLKTKMMRQEMPRRFWKNLPEARLIPELIRDAPDHIAAMMHKTVATSARDFLPQTISFRTLFSAIAKCQGCELATCTLTQHPNSSCFNASIAFISFEPLTAEQASSWSRLLSQTTLGNQEIYFTSALKHPYQSGRKSKFFYLSACRPFLVAELELLKPKLIICENLLAGFSVFGRRMSTHEQNTLMSSPFSSYTIILPSDINTPFNLPSLLH